MSVVMSIFTMATTPLFNVGVFVPRRVALWRARSSQASTVRLIFSSRQQVVLDSKEHDAGSAVDAGLAIDADDVRVNSGLGDVERARDCPIATACGQMTENVHFSVGEGRRPGHSVALAALATGFQDRGDGSPIELARGRTPEQLVGGLALLKAGRQLRSSSRA
jgi:hypothetical protein